MKNANVLFLINNNKRTSKRSKERSRVRVILRSGMSNARRKLIIEERKMKSRRRFSTKMSKSREVDRILGNALYLIAT